MGLVCIVSLLCNKGEIVSKGEADDKVEQVKDSKESTPQVTAEVITNSKCEWDFDTKATDSNYSDRGETLRSYEAENPPRNV